MLTATCHCGDVRVEVPRKPRSLTDCNCSICRRYGALWAYYKARDVRVICDAGATAEYVWGDRTLKFIRCRRCGCVTHWKRMHSNAESKLGVNARNFDTDAVASVRIRHLDGADTWKYLD